MFSAPEKTRSEILKTLEGKISTIDFEKTEDLLTDSGIVSIRYKEKKIDGKTLFAPVYVPDEETTINSVKLYLERSLKR